MGKCFFSRRGTVWIFPVVLKFAATRADKFDEAKCLPGHSRMAQTRMSAMTVPESTSRPPGAAPPREDPAARARRIADLKRRVESGTYLIQRYEIIEGLLDALGTDAE